MASIHHHSGIDRPVGKSAPETAVVEGDVLDADARVIGPDIDHPVDQRIGKRCGSVLRIH